MIPLKIETLLKGRVVEHDRVEYKTGWNPNELIISDGDIWKILLRKAIAA